MKNKNGNQIVKLKFYGIPKVIPYMLAHKNLILVMIICGLLGTVVDIVLPLFQKYAINVFIGQSDLSNLAIFIILYLFVLAFQITVNFIATYNSSRVELYMNRDLRQAAFSHLQTLSFSYFNQNSVGYIHARVMSDTAKIGELASWSFMDIVWHFSYIIGAIAVMFALNWKLALFVVIVVPIATVLVAIFHGKLVKANRTIREKNSIITGNYNEGITGAKTIKTLGIENKMYEDFKKDTLEMKKVSIKAQQFRTLFWSTVSFCAYLALAIVLWRGGIMTMEQVIEFGTLNVFMDYALGIMEPILFVVDSISSLINAQVNIERFTALMETKSDVVDSNEVVEKYGDTFNAKKENWEELNGDIEFKDVSFKYPDGDEFVLEHFNLKIKAGTSVAIVGETGAGKSTLVNLVCRFYEPTSGQILIDGKDARERSQLWLHSNIGYVLQTPHLFSGTIKENLKYGNLNASDEELYSALEKVSAVDIVEKMDNGLDSEVGEGGDLLSTGEKQLVSFARAIIADPKILVLDEATSSVDTRTEMKIQNAITEVINNRTSFVIAHRLSTIRNSDIILVVKDGKIIEQGKHSELMNMKGYYYSLYLRQFEEEIINNIV